MAASDGLVPDWRDAAAYEPLLEADRSLFAWEWLRRDESYRTAAARAFDAVGSRDPAEYGRAPERWGLHAFEAPGATVPEARPVWCAEVHPFVLGIEAGASDDGDLFDLERFADISTLITASDGRKHLLLSDGLRAIRIDVLAGTVGAGPAELRCRLAGLASAERSVLTLRRLLALWRTGRFCRSLHRDGARVKRRLLVLRARDAIAAGADQREIAAELLSAEAHRPRWRSRSPSVRAQVQRLVRGARRMAAGAYLELL